MVWQQGLLIDRSASASARRRESSSVCEGEVAGALAELK
jgi:hypothetical protein